MNQVNFEHLRYFWIVASAGSIARASEQLHLTPQSISGQLRELEQSLGIPLFRRAGRGLQLTESGRMIFSYAEEIFSIGEEMVNAIKDNKNSKSLPLRVGITDSVPKILAYRLIEPVFTLPENIRLICREGRLSSLLADLAIHNLDIVIADQPMSATVNVRGFNHLLGQSPLGIYGAAKLISRLPKKFPANLHKAPLLLPGEDVAIRGKLLQWLEKNHLQPQIIGEFDDGALMKAFGQAGSGLFVAPTAIAEDIHERYRCKLLGEIDSISEDIYAITTDRRLTHPAIVKISNTAKQTLFNR